MQQGDGKPGEGREEGSLHLDQEGSVLLCSGILSLALSYHLSYSVQDEEDFKTRVLASQVLQLILIACHWF